jgi:UDP-3-O-[3-hydroxymyristoyl] glucosamine N-acyltransferase
LNGHIHIGDGATIAAQAGVFGDVPAGAVYSGYPARPHKEALRAQAALFRLPALLKRLRLNVPGSGGGGRSEA